MEIALVSDHKGHQLKQILQTFLIEQKGINVIDYGAKAHETVAYPDAAAKLCKAVLDADILGIAIGEFGTEMTIACNKHKGIRAVNIFNQVVAKSAREDTNANVICLGEKIMDFERAKEVINIFLDASFRGGSKLDEIDKIHVFEN